MLRKIAFLVLVGWGLFASCSKNTSVDGNGPGSGSDTTGTADSALVGNYDFLFLTGTLDATAEGNYLGQAVKNVITGNFASEQNTGTITFTKDSLLARGLGYTINDTAESVIYINGIPTGSTPQPLNATGQDLNSSAKYQVIGRDSLNFPDGLNLGTIGGTDITPKGGHFVIKGDTLTITSRINQSFPDTLNGVPLTVNGVANVSIFMLKQ